MGWYQLWLCWAVIGVGVMAWLGREEECFCGLAISSLHSFEGHTWLGCGEERPESRAAVITGHMQSGV